jgi:SNF2 family DNA or RNA helicase
MSTQPAREIVLPDDYRYKTDPYYHQNDLFVRTRLKEYFAYLMEQGTGKTKPAIDTATYLYSKGLIDAVFVAAPNGVHKNWVLNEIPIHCPLDPALQITAYWSANMLAQEKRRFEDLYNNQKIGLRFFAMNYEAISTPRAYKEVIRFCNTFRVLAIGDESTRMKTPGAAVTKHMMNVGKKSQYRRILNGTPVTKNPFDVYAQFKFLSPQVLGFSSFLSFKHHFGEFEKAMNYHTGKEYDNLLSYRNLDELKKLIAPHSYRVLKKDCLDLPDKVYMRRLVTLSDEQKRLYKSMAEHLRADIGGKQITAKMAMVKLLRLQQIIGGFVSLPSQIVLQHIETENGDLFEYVDKFETIAVEGPNNRIAAMDAILHESTGKVIIWARFRAEIQAIYAHIQEEFGPESVVHYYGDTSDQDRLLAVDRFQDIARNPKDPTQFWEEKSKVQFFIGNPAAAGVGLTLTNASEVIYYSNDFSLYKRLQSEDRVHRIGLKHPVTYHDLECEGTIDTDILAALITKKGYANQVTGDEDDGWLKIDQKGIEEALFSAI